MQDNGRHHLGRFYAGNSGLAVSAAAALMMPIVARPVTVAGALAARLVRTVMVVAVRLLRWCRFGARTVATFRSRRAGTPTSAVDAAQQRESCCGTGDDSLDSAFHGFDAKTGSANGQSSSSRPRARFPNWSLY